MTTQKIDPNTVGGKIYLIGAIFVAAGSVCFLALFAVLIGIITGAFN